MLYILFGDDDFSRHEELEGIKRGLGNGELLSSNTTVLDGQRLSVDELRAISDALPFLGQTRLVIVHGLLSRFERNSRARSSARSDANTGSRRQATDWLTFDEHVAAMPASTMLVFMDSGLRRDNPLLRRLSPKATVKEFPPLNRGRLRNWIRVRVGKLGSSISPSANNLLVELIGSNLWILSSEIEKLCLWAGPREIEEKDVRQLVSQAQEANIFAMVDAIVESKINLAIKLLHQLLDEGRAAPYLLVMITRQFRLLLQVKEFNSQGLPRAEIRKRLGLYSDYVFRKTLEQAQGYSLTKLEEVYSRLLETDLSIKTGKCDGELALDLFVTELCRR